MEKNSIEAMIFEVKRRPTLYLTDDSINSLNSFLTGWMTRDVNTIIDLDIINQFQIWIQNKYNQDGGEKGWCSIILFYSVNGHTALKRFFELFDDFISQRSISPPAAVGKL